MVSKADEVVRLDFRRRVEEMRQGICSGEVKFFNPPDEWTDKLLNTTALNCTLLLLAELSKWN